VESPGYSTVLDGSQDPPAQKFDVAFAKLLWPLVYGWYKLVSFGILSVDRPLLCQILVVV